MRIAWHSRNTIVPKQHIRKDFSTGQHVNKTKGVRNGTTKN